MTRVYLKKKCNPYVMQTISAIILIIAILVSYTAIDMKLKALIYLFCFMENFALIFLSVNGVGIYAKGLKSVGAYYKNEFNQDLISKKDKEEKQGEKK